MFLLKRSSFHQFLFILVVVLFSSCERTETSHTYYNIDSLIQVQVTYLAQSKARLHKKATINLDSQDTTFMPGDSAAWSKELDIFREMDLINKPINEGNYTVSDGHTDVTSNLTVRTYATTKELSIVYLKLFYQDSPTKLRKIEALYNQENALLKTRRKLVMEFTDIYNKNILSSYSIEGTQKMFIGDEVRFTVTCSVQLN